MENTKVVFVTGATGNQGGAVARHLISKGFVVKALTRTTTGAAAQRLAAIGVQLIQGNLNDPNSYSEHVKNVAGVFSVQTFVNGIENEIKQGIGIANIAVASNVRHFVYSSVAGAELNTGIPHWESKAVVENYIKQLQLPYTILRPVSFYENFLIPQVKSRLLKGKLVSPVNKSVIQQFISVEDIGRITAEIFTHPEKYLHQTISLAAEQSDNQQLASLFSQTLGKDIQYKKLPSLITRLFMGKDLFTMFSWLNKHGGQLAGNMDVVKKDFHPFLSLKEWIPTHFNNR